MTDDSVSERFDDLLRRSRREYGEHARLEQTDPRSMLLKTIREVQTLEQIAAAWKDIEQWYREHPDDVIREAEYLANLEDWIRGAAKEQG